MVFRLCLLVQITILLMHLTTNHLEKIIKIKYCKLPMKKINLLLVFTFLVSFSFNNRDAIGQISATNFVDLTLNAQLVSDSKVKLSWVTPVAYQSSSYIIQKSTNGYTFDDIGQAPARFDDKKRLLYVMYDDDFSSSDKEISYKMVEFKDNGKSKITEIVSVVLTSTTQTVASVSVSNSSKISIEKDGMIDQIRIKGSSDFKLAQVISKFIINC